MNPDTDPVFSELLPTASFLLVYSLPLLLISLLLNFAGAFLTLDRSRSFPPQHLREYTHALTRYHKILHLAHQFLQTGLGGWATGYTFAVHSTTFLATLIPSLTPSAPLSSKSFLATWLLSAILCAGIAGRWRYLAFALAGFTGSTAFALSISIMFHPSLLARRVLTAICVPIGTILCLVPVPKFSHAPLRIACAALGSFGVVVSTAILARIPSWGDPWRHYWSPSAVEWESSKEKALSAMYCVLLVIGVLCDWLLHRKVGGNPDQDWDEYLVHYSQNLSEPYNRQGTFAPLPSFWDQLKGLRVRKKDQLVHTSYDNLDIAHAASFSSSFNLPDKPSSVQIYSDSHMPAQLVDSNQQKPSLLHGRSQSTAKLHSLTVMNLSSIEEKVTQDSLLLDPVLQGHGQKDQCSIGSGWPDEMFSNADLDWACFWKDVRSQAQL